MVSTADHTTILAVDSRCTHGEGVLWCEQREALYWVDISEKRLWRHHPGSAQTRFWTLPDRPGCIGLMDDGRVLIALAKAICIADPDNADGDTLPLDHLADVEADNPLTRSNDGRADRHGNFVFGTMDEHEDKAARGAMYQFSLRHGLRRLPLPGVSIPNSICFSPDGRTLYYCDSVRPQILRCDYDPDTAQTSNTRVFTTLDRDDAEPDGSIIDNAGHLWNAQWRAWRVVRYRPDGSVERVVQMPVKHPTCSAFGGAELDRLHVISSRLDHSDAELAQTPQAGGLYLCDLPVRGLPESRVTSA
ncbi:SMP-30/gluconolactonase/LRE family protein [Xanthomonas campestris pv. raphani]|uniref:SMP-30/gluconolactonase/LRE family protein n=1 Tax=Xanthomonas campestris TaxID=339 RepID=UPI002368E368|nr:SMP-30/gluconolactonase/LRE family protein [Xanthomonas campestris]MEB2183600.1 SMP-30/gluconolactonase/LRE family protein [Xanthomonas campestris pv. campestris]MEA9757134.1 SMP-30/gluconolactonase/LRE family protein [Xanthomonas campestris pv. raphani]MEA9765258.1 SMP-30/gluconolactonase/LRE family protein [Xanthomonas campestris pv. raphani]MEA9817469.1 SMP-30/gluconolactonase/LRE family protein [Xanthomonas campestris pv. raphani]MEA9825013.1 SMP-30/gluconolactonase/LRE family protein [